MADKKISALTSATTPLAGTEVLPIVQSSSTVKVSVANLTAGRAVAMLSNTMVSASAVNDVDKTGGSSYAYRLKGNDQANVRFRFENSGGRTWEVIGGYAGANNTYFSIYDVTGSATRFSIDDSGNVRADTGNFVPATAAKGVNFTANTPAAGMTSQLLNWYEEGTWTPAITSSGGSITTSSASGTYTRVGRTVMLRWFITITTAGTASGTATVTGLPFTSSNIAGAISNATGNTFETGVTGNTYFAFVQNNSSQIKLQSFTNGAIGWGDGYVYEGSIVYQV